MALVIGRVGRKIFRALVKDACFTNLRSVYIEFQGDSRWSIVDGQSSKVIGKAVKVMSWYGNG